VPGRVQPRQLAFALPHAESLSRDDFLEGPANEAGLALVDSWPDWPNPIMLLVGPEGAGKSHLAAIWAEQAGARSTSAHALTAAAVPSAFAIELRDLRSRLRAVPTVSLLPPDDQLFRALIIKFCADRQMTVDESVVSYLTTRIERSYAAVRQAVELLDSEALRLGRPVTRALAADLLRDA
jgi:chromosomal replication initiation ATPase DnaA